MTSPTSRLRAGDFGDMRQLVVEYDASTPGQEALRARYGITPVLSILIRAHQYSMARYDFDGFRIDTVKYVEPEAIEMFGNAMREFAYAIGKQNFFTFGEVYDDEETIARFIGRNGGSRRRLRHRCRARLSAVLQATRRCQGHARRRRDPPCIRGPQAAGGRTAQLARRGRQIFRQLSRQPRPAERIPQPDTPIDQVTLAIALLFTLQGIPSLYYGTEQGLRAQ